MNWKIKIALLFFLVLGACKKGAETKEIESEYFNTEHIIEGETLMDILGNPGIIVIDFRKKEDYAVGHIPGALQIWRSDIEDTSSTYSGMMASKEQIEELLSRLGVKNTDTLVVYDDKGGSDAARFWWVMENYGFNKVKILNGGLKSWKTTAGHLSYLITEITPSRFKLPNQTSAHLFIKHDELLEAISDSIHQTIIDTRTVDEYTGKRQKIGAVVGGRIPGSIHIDWAECIDYHSTLKFKSYEELVAIFAPLGLAKDDPILTYCHTGVRSAHTTFVLTELLGYTNVKNYDGSWTEWSQLEGYPVTKDSLTLILQ